jgi:hypothetical protein
MIWRARRGPWPCWLALAGLTVTAGFVVIRAASFHHIDHLLGVRITLVPLNFILETGGIALTIAGAASDRPKRSNPAR